MTNLEIKETADNILSLSMSGDRRSSWELEQLLAAEFGRRNGWRLAQHRFTLQALRDRKVHSYRRWPNRDEQYPSAYFDHKYFYRYPDRRASAIAVHLYDVRGDTQAWAQKNGLQVSFPDFPSWHFPNRTKLVVYRAVEKAKHDMSINEEALIINPAALEKN